MVVRLQGGLRFLAHSSVGFEPVFLRLKEDAVTISPKHSSTHNFAVGFCRTPVMSDHEEAMELSSVASDEGQDIGHLPSSSSVKTPEQQVSLHRYGRCTYTTTQGAVVETTGVLGSSSTDKPWACRFCTARFAKVQGLRGHEHGKHPVLLKELKKKAASGMPLTFADGDGFAVPDEQKAEDAVRAEEAEEASPVEEALEESNEAGQQCKVVDMAHTQAKNLRGSDS